MKYKSELIKEIVESRGHEKSSLHYESECIESWINENKGSYPKLTDYQSEWLNYIEEHPNGIFPYVTLSDVTDATVENVVPYAYKSAILKGNTINCLLSTKNVSVASSPVVNSFTRQLEVGETYTVFYNYTVTGDDMSVVVGQARVGTSSTGIIESSIVNGKMSAGTYIGKKVVTLTDISSRMLIGWIRTGTGTLTVNELYCIEGDYSNVNIPFVSTGLQSVKMPVLTTLGKNLFHSDIQVFNLDNYIRTGNDINTVCDTELKPSTTYTLSWNGNNRDGKVRLFSNGIKTNSIDIGWHHSSVTFTTSEVENGFSFYSQLSEDSSLTSDMSFNVQLEEGTTATPYEPFKSNILTVNEEVELRSNRNICDELNLLTGQLTQRIDEDGEVLSQEVVKTVDLIITNQDDESLIKIKPIEGTMQLKTSSDTIQPLFSGEIPVEAITQNLTSFIEE